jgi:hypothetical protein
LKCPSIPALGHFFIGFPNGHAAHSIPFDGRMRYSILDSSKQNLFGEHTNGARTVRIELKIMTYMKRRRFQHLFMIFTPLSCIDMQLKVVISV